MTQAAGKLNHRIRFNSLQTAQDSNGDPVEQWIDEGEVWAEFVPSSAREFVSSQQMQSKVVGRFTIRRHPRVQANWRISFRGQHYNIEGVLPDPVSGLEYFTLPVSNFIEP